MKSPFALSIKPTARSIRIGSLIVELTLSGVVSIACAIGALSVGRDQFAENWIPWTAPVILMLVISLLYVGVLVHQYQKIDEAQKNEMEILYRKWESRRVQH